LGYVHNQFTYDVAEYSPDSQKQLNVGLADPIDKLQEVISWFINSRVTAVRKTIQNWIVVDTSAIEVADLNARSPVLRLKANKTGSAGIDRYIKQLEINDTTQGHINDVKELSNFVQIVTGINDNALGMFHGGRRSATEARNVNSASAARLTLNAKLIYKTGLAPLAKKMVSNLRQGLDEPTFVRVIGDPANVMAYAEFVSVDKSSLVGNYDLSVFDASLPMERNFQADALQELLQLAFTNPQLAIQLGININALLKEILQLRSIRHPERFFNLPPTSLYGQQPQVQGQPGAAPGQPPAIPVAGGANGVAGQAGGVPGLSDLSALLGVGQNGSAGANGTRL
jgi:hypothetical protein